MSLARVNYWKGIMRVTYNLESLKVAARHGDDIEAKYLEDDDYAYKQAAIEL